MIRRILFIVILTQLAVFADGQEFREIVIENFEGLPYTEKNLKIRKELTYYPEIQMSRVILAPVIKTKNSLYIRLEERVEEPFSIDLHAPFVVTGYAEELVLQVYSSGFDGEVSVILRNFYQDVSRYSVTTLNFSGWREIHFKIPASLNQNDFGVYSERNFEIVGIAINERSHVKGRENIIAFDDIIIRSRDKLKIPERVKKITD